MPRGVYARSKKEEAKTDVEEIQKIADETAEAEVEEALKVVEEGTKPKSEIPKLESLAIGQAYFEAPDGTVLIGDDTRNDIWYRAGNNGKGMWINKMHESAVVARGGTVFHKKQ